MSSGISSLFNSNKIEHFYLFWTLKSNSDDVAQESADMVNILLLMAEKRRSSRLKRKHTA
jgi:hypothetical protein